MLPKLLTLCLFVTLIQAQKDKSNKDNDEEQCTNLKTFTDSSSNTNTNSESNEKPNVKASKQFTKQNTASKSVPLRPNIILTLFDDLGYHDLGNYDNVARHQCKTPVMDHLMSTGIRLQNFYAMPICSPTRAAIMTGRYPIRYGGNCGTPPGLAADQGWAPLGEPMLAERLRDAGYVTKMAGKWHLGLSTPKVTPTGRGFNEFFGKYRGGGDHWVHTTDIFADQKVGSVWPGHPSYVAADGMLDLHHDKWNKDGTHSHRHIGHMNGTHSTDVITNAAINMIKQHDPQGPPMFLYLAYQAPHWPVQNPSGTEERHFGVPLMGKQRRKWCGLVSHIDDNIGRLYAALHAQGMADNTLFLALSDNGGDIRTGASNYPYRGDKMTPWEGGTKTPLFISSTNKDIIPKHLRGTINNGLGHVTDLFSTLLSVAGGDITPNERGPMDGLNLWPSWMSGKHNQSPRTEMLYNIDNDGLASVGAKLFAGGVSMGSKMKPQEAISMVVRMTHGNVPITYGAIRVGKYKLIKGYPGRSDWYGTDPTETFLADYIMGPDATDYDLLASGGPFNDMKVGDGGGKDINDDLQGAANMRQYLKDMWLFDLELDPAEHNDLALSMPAKVAELNQRLEYWKTQTAPALATLPYKVWTKEKRAQERARSTKGTKIYPGYSHTVTDWWQTPEGWEAVPPVENKGNSKL